MRKNFLPRTPIDIISSLIMAAGPSITVIFEAATLLPEFFKYGSIFYNLSMVGAVIINFNAIANMLFCMLTDTSINQEAIKSYEEQVDWRFCSICKTNVPPRSWHCKSCRTCILKRDHHCVFTGCCIGHRNHRYFIMILINLFLGAAFIVAFCSVYIWWIKYDDYFKISTLLKVLCPMLMLFLDSPKMNFIFIIYIANVYAFIQTTYLLIHHWKLICKGAVGWERNDSKYNLGFKRNLQMVFGKRWFLVWISPFITSELPSDGFHWVTDFKEKSKPI